MLNIKLSIFVKILATFRLRLHLYDFKLYSYMMLLTKYDILYLCCERKLLLHRSFEVIALDHDRDRFQLYLKYIKIIIRFSDMTVIKDDSTGNKSYQASLMNIN